MSDKSRPLVVVGVDGSPLSIEAIRWAAGYARTIGGSLLAVTGYEVPWTIFFAPTATEEDYEKAARVVIDEAVAQALGDEPDIPVATRLVGNRPAHALTDSAAGADLLVVGSHGRGAMPGMHLGSVANYCVHHAPCPVLVYRTAQSGR
ncbi:MAG: universal stress protein [Candidatus Nanopelagicales bacterium]